MANGFDIVWTGVREFNYSIDRLNLKMLEGTKKGVLQVALAIQRQARINATGDARKGPTMGRDPGTGPGVVTGRLRNSIKIVDQGMVGKWGYEASVAPTVIYGRRLELGFTGTDSIGRHYDQPPYPYMQPAFDFVIKGWVARMLFERAWAEAAALL